MKNVIIADSCCLCYGANNAIQKTIEALKSGKKVAMLHEILHNKNVMNKLACMGARVIEDVNDVHTGECVIICAHGEGKATFDFLQNSSIEYLDCTCPNVKAIEDLVKVKNGEGYKIIVIGKHGFDGKKIHAEVKGTMGWCDNPILIEDESEIKNINLDYDKYFLVVQTTFAKDLAEKFIVKIEKLMKDNNKIFEYKNTICGAQKQINTSAVELCKKVDTMVVVGGKNSNNSKELYNNVKSYIPAVFVESLDELRSVAKTGIFDKNQTIGITAGASTMKEDVEEMKQFLELL